MNDFLIVKDLSCEINSSVILDKLSFSIRNKGEIISFLGPSGVGKTTLIRCIAGLEKISSGEIVMNGSLYSTKINSIEPEKRNMALSFQENCLFPNKTVLENIDIGFSRKKKPLKLTKNYLINLFNLSEIVSKYPHEISSGEIQRAQILRALISNPDLLLLDEPFSNIDQDQREELQTNLKRVLKDNNIPTIIVTHDINEAFYMSDKCGVLIKNSIVQFDTPYNIHHYPNSKEVMQFISRGSLIKVKVLDKKTVFHKKLGKIKGNFITAPKIDSTVKLLIQPEDITHDNTSKLKLKICDRKFRGTNFIYYLKLNTNEAIPVSVQSHNCEPCNINDELGIKLPIFINHLVFF